jgi:tetratricopeptide (TPR) repeat protein
MTGIIGSIAFFNTLMKKYGLFPLFVLLVSGIFPALYIALQHSVLHDGWRHLLFIYPSLVILAALFWVALTNYFIRKKLYRYLGYAFVGITCLETGLFIARNHNYPYVYFNPMAGGMKQAFGNFETDYWGIGVKQAINWMEDQKILDPEMDDSITIATSFYYNLTHQLDASFRNKVKVKYLRYPDRYNEEWDYAIYPSRYVPGIQLRSGYWPPQETVHSIKANSVPLVAILKGRTVDIQHGLKAVQEMNWLSANSLLESSLIQFPKNDVVMRGLAITKMNIGAFDEAFKLANQSMEITGPNPEAFSIIGLIHQATQDNEAAKKGFYQAIAKDPSFYPAYYYLALIYNEENNIQTALDNASRSIQIKNDFVPPYQLISQLYEREGNSEKADFYQSEYVRLSSITSNK